MGRSHRWRAGRLSCMHVPQPARLTVKPAKAASPKTVKPALKPKPQGHLGQLVNTRGQACQKGQAV